MSPPKDDDPAKPSGRVRHDSGGRAVWEWAMDSGKHAIDSTSRLLKRLDLSSLTLLDEHGKDAEQSATDEESGLAIEGERKGDAPAAGKAGFNPYDRRIPAGQRKPAEKPKPPARPRITQPVVPVKEKKLGFFEKLFGRGSK